MQVNKGAVQSMGLRVHEVALTLAELLPAAVAAGAVTPAATVHLKRLEGLVAECGAFVAEYGSRGFLSRIMKSSWDAIRVSPWPLTQQPITRGLPITRGFRGGTWKKTHRSAAGATRSPPKAK